VKKLKTVFYAITAVLIIIISVKAIKQELGNRQACEQGVLIKAEPEMGSHLKSGVFYTTVGYTYKGRHYSGEVSSTYQIDALDSCFIKILPSHPSYLCLCDSLHKHK
jgi:hypothetical protein